MALGTQLTRKVGEAIVVEFSLKQAGVLQTGKSPVVTVFDEADVSFSTPTVTEPISGLYRASFTPDAAGTWHARIVEATIPYQEARGYDVAASVIGDNVALIDDIEADIAVIGANVDDLVLAGFVRRFTVATSSTTTEVRSNVSTTDGNDYHKGGFVLVRDSSTGQAQARVVNQYFQTNDRFLFLVPLDFTPEIGVDQVYVMPEWIGRLVELLDIAAAGNPPANSWMDRILNKDGSFLFDRTTDSLEALRDRVDALIGTPAGASVSADVAAVQATASAVEVDTQDIQSRLPAALVGGRMSADVGSVSGDVVAADNLEADYDGTGYAKAASTVGTVTTLTGHTPQTGDNFARLGAPAGASVSADVAAVKVDTATLLSRVTATLFAGVTSLGQWLGLLAGKQVGDATARTEVRATGAGAGTYDEVTDSQEAIRNAVDTRSAPGDAMTLAANTITAAVIATGAVDADALAADASTEINAAVLSAISALNNLSQAQAQSAAAAAIAADASIAAILANGRPESVDINTSTGVMTLFADSARTTPLNTWQLYMDLAGTQPYDGTGAVHRWDRLT